MTLSPDSDTVFRYRLLLHDGPPDPSLDERIWHDFAEPPEVALDPPST